MYIRYGQNIMWVVCRGASSAGPLLSMMQSGGAAPSNSYRIERAAWRQVDSRLSQGAAGVRPLATAPQAEAPARGLASASAAPLAGSPGLMATSRSPVSHWSADEESEAGAGTSTVSKGTFWAGWTPAGRRCHLICSPLQWKGLQIADQGQAQGCQVGGDTGPA